MLETAPMSKNGGLHIFTTTILVPKSTDFMLQSMHNGGRAEPSHRQGDHYEPESSIHIDSKEDPVAS